MAAKRKAQAEAAPVSIERRGRPSTYTKDVADEICERLSNGEPLAQICRDEDMPAYRTVYDWQDNHPDFSANIARARTDGYEVLAADCLNISDENGRDMRFTEKGAVVIDNDVIQRAKLRIDTRLKLLSKWDPKRYGEKLDVNATVAGEIKIVVGGDI